MRDIDRINWRAILHTPKTLDDYIDRIAIENGYMHSAGGNNLFSPNHERYKKELLEQIQTLIDKRVNEARIDEIKHIVSGSEYSADDFDWYEITREEYSGTNYYSEVHHLSKDERLAQLQSNTSKGDE